MQNKKAALTENMVDYLRAKIVDPNGFIAAIINWCIIILVERYQGCEWCQKKEPQKDPKTGKLQFDEYSPEGKFKNLIYAKCREDWDFVNF